MAGRLARRRENGAVLAETLAVIGVYFPIIVLAIFVVIEATYAYTIARNMNNAAFLAARALAVAYRTNPGIATDEAAQQAIYSTIRIPSMVTGNAQFTTEDGWDLGSTPPAVTVTVQYLPGQGTPALPPFPRPDLLNLGAHLKIAGHCTYRLQ